MDHFGVTLGHFWCLKMSEDYFGVTWGLLMFTLGSLSAIEGEFGRTLPLLGITFRI